jgi:hypothetical protein
MTTFSAGPSPQLLLVVAGTHLVDRRIEGEGLELSEAARMHRLDDDQAPDRVQLEPRGIDNEVELVRM